MRKCIKINIEKARLHHFEKKMCFFSGTNCVKCDSIDITFVDKTVVPLDKKLFTNISSISLSLLQFTSPLFRSHLLVLFHSDNHLEYLG